MRGRGCDQRQRDRRRDHRRLRPAVYVKGPDYAASEDFGLPSEKAAIAAVGGRFHITTSKKWSSTKLLRSVRLPGAVSEYLETCRKRGFLARILDAFALADKQRIVFVGKTIIDKYRYVKPLAKPSKEFILATVAHGIPEAFEGGVVAAAKHGGWPNVKMVTSNAHIIKTRFVEADFAQAVRGLLGAGDRQ